MDIYAEQLTETINKALDLLDPKHEVMRIHHATVSGNMLSIPVSGQNKSRQLIALLQPFGIDAHFLPSSKMATSIEIPLDQQQMEEKLVHLSECLEDMCMNRLRKQKLFSDRYHSFDHLQPQPVAATR